MVQDVALRGYHGDCTKRPQEGRVFVSEVSGLGFRVQGLRFSLGDAEVSEMRHQMTKW